MFFSFLWIYELIQLNIKIGYKFEIGHLIRKPEKNINM